MTLDDAKFVDALRHCVLCEKDPEKWAIMQLSTYNPETGYFFWKPRPLICFTGGLRDQMQWIGHYCHKPAGAKNWRSPKSDPNRQRSCILLTFTYGGVVRRHLAHRMAWMISHGPVPEDRIIDHIDRDPFNNVLTNLRTVEFRENIWNRKFKRHPKKYLGVFKHPGCVRFHSKISENGKLKTIGLFGTAEEAARAYDAEALRQRGPDFVYENLNFPPTHQTA